MPPKRNFRKKNINKKNILNRKKNKPNNKNRLNKNNKNRLNKNNKNRPNKNKKLFLPLKHFDLNTKLEIFYNYIKNYNSKEIIPEYELKENNFINQMIEQKNNNSILQPEIFDKILIIIACHINENYKLETLINNYKYFKDFNIIIINTSGLILNDKVNLFCIENNIKYFEVPNEVLVDFGKWYYVLNNFDYSIYDYIVFSNDSIYLTYNINHFFNLIIENKCEIYGYNDSSQCNYHIQSYLFSIKKDSIYKFINHIELIKPIVIEYKDLIPNTELKMSNLFEKKDCFLKIAFIESNHKQNISFSNDSLYKKLFDSNLYPIIKLRRLAQL